MNIFKRAIQRGYTFARRSSKSTNKGYTLLEMSIVLILIAIGVTAASQVYQDRARTNLAKSVADELVMVDGALAAYGTANYTAIQAHNVVAGVNDPLNPTLAELTALSYIPSGFMSAGHNLLGNHYVFRIAMIDSPPGQAIPPRGAWLPTLALPAVYTAESATTPKNLALAYIVYTDSTYADSAFLDKVIASAAKIEVIGKNIAYTDNVNPNKLIGLSDVASWINPVGAGGVLMMATGFGMVAPSFLQQVGDKRDLTVSGLIAAATSYFQDVTQAGQLYNAGQIISQNDVIANSFWMNSRATSDLCGAVGQMTTDVYGNLVNCTGVAAGINWVPNINGVATAASGVGVVQSSANPYLVGLLAYNNATGVGICVPTVMTITISKDIVLPPSCQTVEVMLRGAGGGGATPYISTPGNGFTYYYSATIPAQAGALVGGLDGNFQNSPGKLFHINIASAFTPPGTAGASSFITDNTGVVILSAAGGAAGGLTSIGFSQFAGAAGAMPTQNSVFGGAGTTLSGAGGVVDLSGNTNILTMGQTPHPLGVITPDPVTGNDLAMAGYGGGGGGGGWSQAVSSNAPIAGAGIFAGQAYYCQLIGYPCSSNPPIFYPPSAGLPILAYNSVYDVYFSGTLNGAWYEYSSAWYPYVSPSGSGMGAADYCWDAFGVPILTPQYDMYGLVCSGFTPPLSGITSVTPSSGGYGAPGVLVLKISQ
jgi:prepilin-type N-terminal cleavage/methylation domain-containing protein